MELTWTGVLLLLCILFTLFSYFQMYKRKGQLPPGPAPWPILGNFFQRDVLPLYKHSQKLAEKYGPIFTVWNGSEPMVVLCGYAMVKDALVDHSEEFAGRSEMPAHKQLFQGKGQPFDPRRIIASAVCNVICAVIFGNRFDYKDKTFIENQKIVETHLRYSISILGLVYNTFPKTVTFFPGPHRSIFANIEKFCDYIRENVDLHKKTLDPQNLRDYIDCFLLRVEKEQNSSESVYTFEDLVFLVFGIFMAGTITTSEALLCSLLAIAKLPHIQAKVQQEIDEVVGTNRTPSMEDRLNMPFTNAFIHEVQRYQKGTLETFPRATTCDTKFHGYTIPKCTAIVPVFTSVHFDPLHWETPEKFNPNHFLDENGQFKRKDAFMAFSAGKRACPGEALARMKLFLFFSNLLQNFTFSLVGDTKDTDVMSLFMDFRNNQYPLIRAVKRSVDTCGQ
ncbi:cytochrome P450 2C31-like isoform X2 [Thamnophis elegans]|uniref:cytochrome P450 2C31-like isoform X2 n=1 Tax=Thamnophis elegans TaxID=35005 RepID=UPI001377A1B0|nr:cytochrome P450 2C31-like isoform X2 [Thamnophis elegans]